jgi:hypothetical protein
MCPPLWSSGQSSWLQNGDVLCFLWGTNWIYICYVEESSPFLWCSGQSLWLQVKRRYQMCRLVSVTGPYCRILAFLDRSHYFFFQVVPIVLSRISAPRSRPTTSQKTWYAPGVESRPQDLQPGTLTIRPQKRSTFFYTTYINSVRTPQEAQ